MARMSKVNQRLAADPLQPSLTLLCKIGSIVVHAEEFLSPSGHSLDLEALKTLFREEDVKQWIKDMGVYMPVKEGNMVRTGVIRHRTVSVCGRA